MRLRLWVGLIALLGVLAHAAAIPRHNAVMLAAGIEDADKQTALAAVGEAPAASNLLCAAGAPWGSGSDRTPGAPDQSSCPICMGMSPGHAILTVWAPEIAAPFAILTTSAPMRAARIGPLKLYRPPVRGPPLAA